jgi:transcriptional regulator with XRE-family HTH domain
MRPTTDENLKALGRAIGMLRCERELTQEDLAYRIPLTVSQLSRIEGGRVNPKWGTLLEIAAGLGVTPMELAAKAAEIKQR